MREAAIWESMRPMTVGLFQRYWDVIEPEKPLFCVPDCTYKEWYDKNGYKYSGS